MLIEKKLIRYNFMKRAGNVTPRFIVVHDTGNPNPGADALAHFRYLTVATGRLRLIILWMM
ncbi:MAG: hypothetical protein E6214_04970 [Peptoniphilus harei]|nr:hypothetical protein [Peptoniphilus harei]